MAETDPCFPVLSLKNLQWKNTRSHATSSPLQLSYLKNLKVFSTLRPLSLHISTPTVIYNSPLHVSFPCFHLSVFAFSSQLSISGSVINNIFSDTATKLSACLPPPWQPFYSLSSSPSSSPLSSWQVRCLALSHTLTRIRLSLLHFLFRFLEFRTL